MTVNNWLKRICRFASEMPMLALNEKEQAIFDFLLSLGVELRVAGGWVRDKLMGKESDDIDIAVEGMTGAELQSYIESYAQAYEQRTGRPHPALGKSYTVKANPEKSKHLETVAMEIFGQKIDFVNLRSEEYGDSRVPTMRMGTPEEDAFRRDLTINSLFYNINTGQIEDLTGHGLEDIQTMTLRTPLDPKKTFLDDPLRMLRALRFYSRYPDAQLDPALVEALGDPEVQAAYQQKVAPERAGPEFTKMLTGAKPADALRVLLETGLDRAVFDIPPVQELGTFDMDQRNKHHALTLLEHMLLVIENMNRLAIEEGLDDDTRMKLNLAALFHDYGKAHPEIPQAKENDPTQMMYKGHEDKSAEIAEEAMKHIGIGRNDRDFVNKVVSMHMRPHAHMGPQQWNKRQIGKFLRDAEIPGQDVGDLWKYIWLHSIADEMSKGTNDFDEGVAYKRQVMQQFEDYLSQPPPIKPLLNGRELIAMFPGIRPDTGFIGFINERMLAEQDAGNITTPEEAKGFVETLRPEVEQQFGPKPPQGPTVAWVKKEMKGLSPS